MTTLNWSMTTLKRQMKKWTNWKKRPNVLNDPSGVFDDYVWLLFYWLFVYKMEKLVELLNKFEKEKIINNWWYVDEDDEYFWRSLEWWDIVNWSFDPDAHWFFKYQIISKDFKFIERLEKNDKIDRPKVWLKIKDLWDEYWWFGIYSWIHIECLIMLLSIQDDPLQFLSWIIK